MRFLHTADWHLGRCFHGTRLIEDQRWALDRLVELAADSRPDALLLAGDVYDRALPGPDAVELLDDVLSRLVLDLKIPVVMIAGNHDSPVRLDFAAGVLGRQRLHVAGSYNPVTKGILFEDAHGEVIVYPLPYAEPAAIRQALLGPRASSPAGSGTVPSEARGLSPSPHANASSPSLEIPHSAFRIPHLLGQADDAGHAPAIIDSHEAALAAAVSLIRAAHPAGRRAVLVGHAFVSGGLATADSERPLSVGGAECVPPSLFDGFHYVALGHLHQPQSIGEGEGPAIHYAGSLLKYSFAEAAHRKAVSLVELDALGRCRVERIALGSRRDVRRIEGELDALLTREPPSDDYLLVSLLDRAALHDPLGRLRDKFPNVLQISLAGSTPGGELDPPDPTEMDEPLDRLFARFVETVSGEAPTPEELATFRAIADRLERRRREAD